MKKLIALVGLCLVSSTYAAIDPVLEESLYYKYQESILNKNQKMNSIVGFTQLEQEIFVDALETLALENSPEALKTLETIDPINFGTLEDLRLSILRLKYETQTELPEAQVNELSALLLDPEIDVKIIYTIAAYEDVLLKAGAGAANIVELAKRHPQYIDVADDNDFRQTLSDDIFTDLVYKTPDVSSYMNGEYVKSVKLFMFCRETRLYPCLMIMKDVDGQLLRNADGKLWNHPSLAASSRGLPSYTTNGQTPTGILTIDSVMPAPDQVPSFGKFRRLILNWIPKSKDEVLMLSLLPPSSKSKLWWKEAQVSRDIGRKYLRIHGSGKINPDANTPYFPFNRTSGCIAQRENTYDGITYKDQRILLDKVMTAMDLKAEYANELKIKGILYIAEINDDQGPVTLEDLNKLGIE
jgi:hypothetical protein